MARSWRQGAVGGVPLALMVLAGHGQVSLYGLIATGGYGLWVALVPVGGGRRLSLPRRLGRLALAGLVGFALSAPMTLPGVERLPWTVRSLMPKELRRGYEFLPALLADSLAPHLHGRGIEGTWFGVNRVEKVYVGAVALYLAVLGVLARPRRALFWLGWGAGDPLCGGIPGPLLPPGGRLALLHRVLEDGTGGLRGRLQPGPAGQPGGGRAGPGCRSEAEPGLGGSPCRCAKGGLLNDRK